MRKTCCSSKIAEHATVEFARLFERRAERLLDDHAHLRALVLRQLRAAQPLDDHREELWRRREIEGPIQRFAGMRVEGVEHLAKLGVDGVVVEHARDVLDLIE